MGELYTLMLDSSIFAGLGFISGMQTAGYHACFICGPNLRDVATYSDAFHKCVYQGHTKYLPLDHESRRDP